MEQGSSGYVDILRDQSGNISYFCLISFLFLALEETAGEKDNYSLGKSCNDK